MPDATFLEKLEKAPLGSKKFLFAAVMSLLWKVLIFFALLSLFDHVDVAEAWRAWVVLAMVIINGFIDVGYIGGQAWLDRYVRVAQIAGKGPGGSEVK